MFWVVEPRETSDDPEHGMIWVVEPNWVVAPMTTQNMACSGSSKCKRQVRGLREARPTGAWLIRTETGGSPKETSDDPEHAMFWVAPESITRPGTWHVLGRRTSDDPEHGMFWVVEPNHATQNIASSGSSHL